MRNNENVEENNPVANIESKQATAHLEKQVRILEGAFAGLDALEAILLEDTDSDKMQFNEVKEAQAFLQDYLDRNR